MSDSPTSNVRATLHKIRSLANDSSVASMKVRLQSILGLADSALQASDEPRAEHPKALQDVVDFWQDAANDYVNREHADLVSSVLRDVRRAAQPPSACRPVFDGKQGTCLACGVTFSCGAETKPAEPPKATHEAIQAAMRAGSWFDRKDLTLHEREIQVAQLFIDYARAAQTKPAAPAKAPCTCLSFQCDQIEGNELAGDRYCKRSDEKPATPACIYRSGCKNHRHCTAAGHCDGPTIDAAPDETTASLNAAETQTVARLSAIAAQVAADETTAAQIPCKDCDDVVWCSRMSGRCKKL